MRLTAKLIALCLAVVPLTQIAAQPQLPGIKGKDNRIWVNGNEAPWQAIGRINKAGMGFCTGVLITPNRVLTAAHCIWNKNRDKPIPGQFLHFLAGYHKESYLAARTIKRVIHSGKFHLETDIKLKHVEQDWAILELKEPVTDVPPIPLVSSSARDLLKRNKRTSLIQAGFSQDRPFILTVDSSCRIKGLVRRRALIAHNCDAVHGDSGSPLLMKTDDGLQVVAIHTSTQHPFKGETLGLAIPGSSIQVD